MSIIDKSIEPAKSSFEDAWKARDVIDDLNVNTLRVAHHCIVESKYPK
jgi:hypothetical protein